MPTLNPTPSKKYSFNAFVNHNSGTLDFDFGAGPKFPRVSPGALAAAEARDSGVCNQVPLPAVCRAPQDPGPGSFWHFDGGVTYLPDSRYQCETQLHKRAHAQI
jgi:hypothetical protein